MENFFIVPTPIGNLGDITNRAIDVLKSVDVIACEDMRVTQKLLNHFGIKTKCISYHKFNEKERVNLFVKLLEDGNKIALVSDAGTPLICDPGSVLVEELRKRDIKITALPGASAVITFLSQISRQDEEFTFVGFLPKTGIDEVIEKHKFSDMVFYESPNRILKTLEIIQKIRPEAKVALGRELTKMYEEVVIKPISEMIDYFREKDIKGEFVGLIFRDIKQNCDIDIYEKIKKLQKKNFKAKEISVILSELYEVNKNDVYKRILETEKK